MAVTPSTAYMSFVVSYRSEFIMRTHRVVAFGDSSARK